MSEEATRSKADLFGDEFGGGLGIAPVIVPEPEVKETQKDQQTVQSFTREIDLGDGSGKQVFTGATVDELLDKLTDAQKNATLKIQELTRGPKTSRIRPETDFHVHVPQKLTDDEVYQLTSGNFDEDRVLNTLLKKRFGDKIDSTTVAGKLEAEQQDQAQREFLKDTPDFVPNQENAKHITDFLTKEQLPLTARNLKYAFQELKADGLFVAAPVNQTTPETRIETKEETSTTTTEKEPKKRSTGVPAIGTSRNNAAEQQITDIDAEVRRIYENPDTEKARQDMQRLMARVNSQNK